MSDVSSSEQPINILLLKMFKEENVEVQYGSLVQLTTALREGCPDEHMTVVSKKYLAG